MTSASRGTKESMDALARTFVASTKSSFPPNKPSLLAELDDLLEEATEHIDAQTPPDPGHAGMVRERLVQVVAKIPTLGKIEAGLFDEVPLRAIPLVEQNELQLEKHYRLNGGPTD